MVAANAMLPGLCGSSTAAPKPVSAVTETLAIILNRFFERIEVFENMLPPPETVRSRDH